jgi:hypothetical protein
MAAAPPLLAAGTLRLKGTSRITATGYTFHLAAAYRLDEGGQLIGTHAYEGGPDAPVRGTWTPEGRIRFTETYTGFDYQYEGVFDGHALRGEWRSPPEVGLQGDFAYATAGAAEAGGPEPTTAGGDAVAASAASAGPPTFRFEAPAAPLRACVLRGRGHATTDTQYRFELEFELRLQADGSIKGVTRYGPASGWPDMTEGDVTGQWSEDGAVEWVEQWQGMPFKYVGVFTGGTVVGRFGRDDWNEQHANSAGAFEYQLDPASVDPDELRKRLAALVDGAVLGGAGECKSTQGPAFRVRRLQLRVVGEATVAGWAEYEAAGVPAAEAKSEFEGQWNREGVFQLRERFAGAPYRYELALMGNQLVGSWWSDSASHSKPDEHGRAAFTLDK